MPNLVAHYICGKLIANKLNIKNEDFLKGCLLPDYIENAHFKTKGKMFLVPDVEAFLKNANISNQYLKLGILTHLLLDKYFLDEYVIEKIYDTIPRNENVFEKDKIYLDYTIISPTLLQIFDIDLEDIEKIFADNKQNINYDKFISTIQEIKNNEKKDPKYLNPESFAFFLEQIADEIINKHLKQLYLPNRHN